MKSAMSSFSKALFYKNLQRFWPVLAAYLLFVLLYSYGLVNAISPDTVFDQDFFLRLLFSGSELLVLLVALFSILAAAPVFSYIHNSIATAMMNALPFDRKTMFFSNYLSGLFMVIIPILVLFLCLVGIGLRYGVLEMEPLLVWLFAFAVLTLLLYSLAVCVGLITGNIIAHLVFYGIANFLVISLEVLVKGFLSLFLYGFSFNSEYVSEIVTPAIYASKELYRYANGNGQWGVWIAYLLTAVLLSGLAYYMYRQRKMENAGDVIAIHKLNPVFKYGVTLCSSLAFGSILMDVFNWQNFFAGAVALFLFAGMVGYFVAEMLMQKTFRVWRTYKGFVVYAIIFVLVSISVYNDWYGYASRLPDAGQVEAVAFSDSGRYTFNVRLLEADRTQVFMDQLINLPDSLAITYGTPLNPDRKSAYESYKYPVMENLSHEEMESLWAITPGIYTSDVGMETVYSLHSFMAGHARELRDIYRQRQQDRSYNWDELRRYTISFVCRMENGKLQHYDFPVFLPLYPRDDLDKQLLNQIAAIVGCQEERSKLIDAVDWEKENIRFLDVSFHLPRYTEWEKKMAAEFAEVRRPTMEVLEKPLEIKPEDRSDFLQAVQADYRDMSDYEILEAELLACATVDMMVEFPHLPSFNRFRERAYHFYLSPYNRHVFDFLLERGYIDAETVQLVKENAGNR